MDLYNENEPSRCTVSDCCNFLFELGRMTESNPFDQFETREDFSGIMADVVNSFSIVNGNMELIYDTEDEDGMMDLLLAMRRVTEAASETIMERNYE